MKNKGFPLIELIFVVAIIMILLAICAPSISKLVGINVEYGSGERTGVVSKISQKGFIWKTWEGEMNLGGMSADSGGVMIPNIWRFSVKDSSLVSKIQTAAAGAKRVTISYSEVVKSSWRDGDTDYFAVAIR